MTARGELYCVHAFWLVGSYHAHLIINYTRVPWGNYSMVAFTCILFNLRQRFSAGRNTVHMHKCLTHALTLSCTYMYM